MLTDDKCISLDKGFVCVQDKAKGCGATVVEFLEVPWNCAMEMA